MQWLPVRMPDVRKSGYPDFRKSGCVFPPYFGLVFLKYVFFTIHIFVKSKLGSMEVIASILARGLSTPQRTSFSTSLHTETSEHHWKATCWGVDTELWISEELVCLWFTPNCFQVHSLENIGVFCQKQIIFIRMRRTRLALGWCRKHNRYNQAGVKPFSIIVEKIQDMFAAFSR